MYDKPRDPVVQKFFEQLKNRDDPTEPITRFVKNYELPTSSWLKIRHFAKFNSMRSLQIAAYHQAKAEAKMLTELVAVAEVSAGQNLENILNLIYSLPLNSKEAVQTLRRSTLQALQHVANYLAVQNNFEEEASRYSEKRISM